MSAMWLDSMVVSLLVGLATYGLSQAIAWREGPMGAFDHLRHLAGTYDLEEYVRPDGRPDKRPKTSIGRLFECPFCLGFWIAFFLTLPFSWVPWWPLMWLAAYGIQTHLQNAAEKV